MAQWFEQAAASGDLFASFNLGICLAKGVGMEADDVQAAQWLRQAAEGLPQANTSMAGCWPRGAALPRTSRLRVTGLPAADSGLGNAQVALAEMMLNGRGGPVDVPGGAMFALGALHGGGHQIPNDRKIAQRWLRAAGEPQPEEARDWFARALAQGIIEAEDDLAALPPDADSDDKSDQDMPAARV